MSSKAKFKVGDKVIPIERELANRTNGSKVWDNKDYYVVTGVGKEYTEGYSYYLEGGNYWLERFLIPYKRILRLNT